jgi:hypothetical protein
MSKNRVKIALILGMLGTFGYGYARTRPLPFINGCGIKNGQCVQTTGCSTGVCQIVNSVCSCIS